jgi:iron-sulfur cluster assembly accessory protein
MIVTTHALAQIDKIRSPTQWFRVQVNAGGCSGLAHEFGLTTECDLTQDVTWGPVCADLTSAEILQNATLDWCSDLSGSQFVLTIPEATSSCGCGKSFSLF